MHPIYCAAHCFACVCEWSKPSTVAMSIFILKAWRIRSKYARQRWSKFFCLFQTQHELAPPSLRDTMMKKITQKSNGRQRIICPFKHRQGESALTHVYVYTATFPAADGRIQKGISICIEQIYIWPSHPVHNFGWTGIGSLARAEKKPCR